MSEEILEMKEEIIRLEGVKYLGEIWKFIPSNAVIHKTLPGFGATTVEINSKRHSIIIEPNVPVIEGKAEKHPNILGVTEIVKVPDIKKYLTGDVEFKKIVTTPESYFKVQIAFNQLGIKYFDEYFLLFDECEKIVSDNDYRDSISLPMDDFWKFRNRTFITATPIDIYPKAFMQNGFKKIIINPELYSFWSNLSIVFTYNVLAIVKMLLERIKIIPDLEDHCYCFFVNSIDMIHNIIKNADIKEICNIYCSEKSVNKLQSLGYDRAYTRLNILGPINFFTSRFYSAVDIETEKSTHVIIVTDCKFAPQTMVHPQTESLQIVGRFRNGVVSFQHVTNIDNGIQIVGLDKVVENIKSEKAGFDSIHTLYKTATDELTKGVIKQALDRIDIAKYITPDYEMDFFKVINAAYKQQIKNMYKSRLLLYSYYLKNMEIQAVNHLTFRRNFKFPDNRYFSRSLGSKKEYRKQIVAELEQISGSDAEITKRLEQMDREDPLIVNAYVVLGKEFIENAKYVESKLYTELIKRAGQNGKIFHPVITAVLNIFKIGYEYFDSEIKEKLQTIYNELDYISTAKATDLQFYFGLSERKTIRKFGKTDKGIKIISAKFTKEKLGQKSSLLDLFKKCPRFQV